MSMGPSGPIGASAAGVPLAQAKGSEVERSGQEATAGLRQADSNEKAELAAGIGRTDGEEQADNDRDADGRRLWERSPQRRQPGSDQPPAEDEPPPPQRKDPTGHCGNQLDLSG